MRIGLITESVLGHRSFGEYLQAALAEQPGVEVDWRPIHVYVQKSRVPKPLRNYALLYGRAAWREAVALEETCDALVLHTHTLALFCRRLMRRIPTLLSMDCTPQLMDQMGEAYGHHRAHPLAERLKTEAWRETFQSAAGLMAWNQWTEDSLRDDYRIAPTRVVVQSPGVDNRTWRPTNEDREPGPVRILFVGMDARRKGLDRILNWADSEVGRRCQVDVVTAHRPTPARDNVVYHHPLPVASSALVRLFQQADVFALPTRSDCHPLVVLEAMAVGLPVISTDVGAVPELVVDGKTGFVVAHDRQMELHQALDRLAVSADLRLEFGRAAQTRAATDFRPEALAKSIVERLQAELHLRSR